MLLQENVDELIECATTDRGFSHGIPVAAFTMYKCLLHWKFLEAEKTNIFERLIQIYISAIEVLRPVIKKTNDYVEIKLIQWHQFFIILVH